jgi:hypothetical protein
MNQSTFLAMFFASTLAGAQTVTVGILTLGQNGATPAVTVPVSVGFPANIITTAAPKFSQDLQPQASSTAETLRSYSMKTNHTISPFGTVKTSVQVDGRCTAQDSTEGFERRVTSNEIESSAGTFGDPSRYMQMLPGVVSDNDQRNDFLVRGGNPTENLFVIDNIEVPSINQLALSDTTGGFVSMIDNAAIQYMTLHTDAYDSKFDQRLSSVVEISTRPESIVKSHSTLEMGLAGAGGSTTRPWGQHGSVFVSGRQSVLQWMTNDIGLNGVPVYQNELIRADRRIDDENNWWGLSLTGIDSIKIRPSATDPWETNPFDITYHGWRNVSGINWQHIFSARSFGIFSLANSQQSQHILETDQLQSNTTIYNENTSDGITTVKYDWTSQINRWMTWEAGARTAVDRMNYLVEQPIGLQNPYSQDPRPMNPTLTDRRFATVSSAEYSQATFRLPLEAKMVVGQRLTHWVLGGHTGWTPKLLLSAPVLGRLVHAGYAEYVQAPPSLYLLTFTNQQTLKPSRARHITVGVNLMDTARYRITVEAYQKRYSDYPVALDYPQLSLANIADTFGEAFLMFPMTSKGGGVARGVEGSIESKAISRLLLTGTVTYARSWFSGLDGVLRRGNFDLPLVANVGGNWHLGRSTSFTIRYSVASGRPYTPDDLPLSLAQNRDVYDLTRINAVRATAYSRLDLRLSHSHVFDRGVLTWHAGMVNALGATNFYSNQWRPRCPTCGVLEQGQMPRLPDVGIQYSF